jgi:hypothetical protein
MRQSTLRSALASHALVEPSGPSAVTQPATPRYTVSPPRDDLCRIFHWNSFDQLSSIGDAVNPYMNLPDQSFWKRSVSGRSVEQVEIETSASFKIARKDAVATAGSCFAQHISRHLNSSGFSFLVTEKAEETPSDNGAYYGLYSAAYGNLYTARQLLQLCDRAYGRLVPYRSAWKRGGLYLDPFRPYLRGKSGFQNQDDVDAEVEKHLWSVRKVFENCRVFVFTLGLTESWHSKIDGSVVPVPPGVVSCDPSEYGFVNFSAEQVRDDLLSFCDKLREVNSKAKVILTVSPVPLVATYEPRNVIVSTVYSKSVLRVAAESVCLARRGVDYFPSYEIVLGPQAGRSSFEDDLRSVKADVVHRVMQNFSRSYMVGTQKYSDLQSQIEGIVCEEQNLDSQ